LSTNLERRKSAYSSRVRTWQELTRFGSYRSIFKRFLEFRFGSSAERTLVYGFRLGYRIYDPISFGFSNTSVKNHSGVVSFIFYEFEQKLSDSAYKLIYDFAVYLKCLPFELYPVGDVELLQDYETNEFTFEVIRPVKLRTKSGLVSCWAIEVKFLVIRNDAKEYSLEDYLWLHHIPKL